MFQFPSEQCNAIDQHLGIPNPMTGDMNLVLGVPSVACPDPEEDALIEEIVVQGGTLTISSAEKVRYVRTLCISPRRGG